MRACSRRGGAWRARLFLGLVFFSASACAGELQLVMFDAPNCPYCAAWEREVGVIYAKTAEGRRAPLTRMPAFGPLPDDMRLSAPVKYSPTFVLLRNAAETYRIDGYQGEDQFWGLLGQALDELPGPD